MRRILLLFAALTAGCSNTDQTSSGETTAAMGDMAAPAIALADVAGTWDVRAMPVGSDSVLTTFVLTATGDTSGWSMMFPNQSAPVMIHVMPPMGDSVVTMAGPYSSALRSNQQVTTETVMRLQDGRMVGTFTAVYASGDTLRGRVEGMRQIPK